MSTANYDIIAEEISQGKIDRGLWLEAFSTSGGDERSTKAQYIKLRLRKLRASGSPSPRARAWAGAWNPTDPLTGQPPWPARALVLAGRFLADGGSVVLWAAATTFAALILVGVLCLGTMCYLQLIGGGALAWSLLTVGCAFLAFLFFSLGVRRLINHPPTPVFYGLELVWLLAMLWPIAHLMNPAWLGLVPPSLSPELVFLVARFLPTANGSANFLTAAIFLLPVYGGIAYARHRQTV